jgi:hypothetical protein
MYLAYITADIGYNLQEWKPGYRAADISRMDFAALPHSCGRARSGATFRMAGIHANGSIPVDSRNLVTESREMEFRRGYLSVLSPPEVHDLLKKRHSYANSMEEPSA